MVFELGVDDDFQPIIDCGDDSTTAILARIADSKFLTAYHLADGFANERYCHAHHMIKVLCSVCYQPIRL